MYQSNNEYVCPYENYYSHQAGSGVGVIYKGAPLQRGHGIGSFLGGLWRSILPLLSGGAKAVGKEAINAGVGLLSDMVNTRPMNDSIKNRLREANSNLKRKIDNKIDNIMSGSGYITKRQRLHSAIRRKPSVKSATKKGGNKKNNNHKNTDIFSI